MMNISLRFSLVWPGFFSLSLSLLLYISAVSYLSASSTHTHVIHVRVVPARHPSICPSLSALFSLSLGLRSPRALLVGAKLVVFGSFFPV
ncbi:hypothetical protein GGS23DRAFT_549470, partial [Durotheca rogersii]|uniref:uncharacterized protein n=1 Tax=Durotheca rogersii TaxID=419775 RepID=UPI00221F9A0E